MEEQGLDPGGCSEPDKSFIDFEKAERGGINVSADHLGDRSLGALLHALRHHDQGSEKLAI